MNDRQLIAGENIPAIYDEQGSSDMLAHVASHAPVGKSTTTTRDLISDSSEATIYVIQYRHVMTPKLTIIMIFHNLHLW